MRRRAAAPQTHMGETRAARQRKGDGDLHHKSNKKRAAKETKNSKRPVKQECADQQRAGHASLDASAVQNPAGMP